MSWLCWNVRGLRNRRTVHELEALVRAQDPVALFLAEMWADEERLHFVCNKLNFDHAWIVPRINSTGCLSLFWKKTVHIEVISSSPNHVDKIVGNSDEDRWRFTGIYGFADSRRKQETWALLRQLHRRISLPWLCAGDFNEIMWAHEKLGRGPRQDRMMREFREVLDECGLMDLGFRGEKYTWKGKRQGGLVLERLDRAVANNSWFASNPGTQVQHLHSHTSDHRPIIVLPEGIFPKPCRPFKFEKMWLSDRGCSDTVISA
ncbi:uncharacterized protein LOC115951389 [Quercus lobata]|uniref:uncharacterized protein LOC115951389 n=1 Tax=Quercus lobata TaxID=97700 RepID=UPI0012455813|nr:uncharacterized protein LOC115951389 [Quercus lobata]